MRMRIESSAFAVDEAVVSAVRGKEAISQLFQFDIDVSYPVDAAPLASDIEGAIATFVLEQKRDQDGSVEGTFFDERRRIHGMISRVDEHFGVSRAHRSFTLRLVPRAHRLTLVKMQDVFVDVAVPDLITKKLSLMGLEGDDRHLGRLGTDYPVRELVVQYGETDMAFINRQTEHFGISYLFDHDECDSIVFCEGSSFPEREAAPIALIDRADEGGIKTLTLSSEVMPESYWVMDYNYRVPATELSSCFVSDQGFAGGVFDYGDHFKTPAEGDALARLRANESRSQHIHFRGTSDVVELSAGYRYRIEDHPVADESHLLIVAIEHEVSAATAEAPASYHNRFVAVAGSVEYCPPRLTPKPRIHGVMSGLVEPEHLGIEEDNAELTPDGRYYVKFLFDTTPLGERRSSKPIRMARTLAGSSYGMHFPVRPGTEVLLAFLNGDPDRPVIVGAVHTGAAKEPLTQSTAQHSIIRTRSGINMVFKDLG